MLIFSLFFYFKQHLFRIRYMFLRGLGRLITKIIKRVSGGRRVELGLCDSDSCQLRI